MKIISAFILTLAFLFAIPTVSNAIVVPNNPLNTVNDTDDNNQNAGTVTTITPYVGGNYGPSFANELTFVENFLESNYILFLALILAIMGFWQFFILSNSFGLVVIILAIGLTAFPGIYKGFYAGTRPFIHEAAGTTETQGWE